MNQYWYGMLVGSCLLGLPKTASADDLFGGVARATMARNDALRKDYQEALQQLKAAQGKVAWAEAGFRDVRYMRSPFEGSTDSLARSMNQQRMALQRLTTLPVYELRHNLTRGDALNRLLDVLGPIAAEHERRLQRLDRFDLSKLTEEERQQHEYLKNFESDLLLAPTTVQSFEFETGQSGSKGRTRLILGSVPGNEQIDPFSLSWPAHLRRPEYEYKVRDVEQARERLLTNPPPPGTTEASLFAELFDAIDELTIRFRVDYDNYLKLGPAVKRDPGDIHRYLQAKRFINDALRPAAQRWQAEGRRSTSAAFWPFARKHPDGRISMIQLCAFLHEQGWRFPEAFQPMTEQSHRQAFDAGQRYYLKLAALRGSLTSLEQDVARAKQDLDQEINREIAVENAQAIANTAQAAGQFFQYLDTIESNREKQRERDEEARRRREQESRNQ